MQSRRCRQVGTILKNEISYVVRNKLSDPRIGFMTITDVILSKDFKTAKIYCSVMGSKEEKEQTIEGLNSASPFIQNEIKPRIRLRNHPVLHFYLDEGWENYLHIDEVIQNLNIPPEPTQEPETEI